MNNNDLSLQELQSKVIDFLRFPLIVAVVFIHSNITGLIAGHNELANSNYTSVFVIFEYIFSKYIPSIAVPLFLFISGYLFFNKAETFTTTTYFAKLKKRAKTILLPYVIWSLIVIIVLWLIEILLPQLMSGSNKPISQFSPIDWITSMLSLSLVEGGKSSFPICYQFWFLRDLMITMIVSPVIYLLIKKLGIYFILSIIVLWSLNFSFIPALYAQTFAFFSIGAFFSIKRINFLPITRNIGFITISIFAIIGIVRRMLDISYIQYFSSLAVICGCIGTLYITSYYIKRGIFRVNRFLSSSSFFVFAYHGLTIIIFKKLLLTLVSPQNDIAFIAVYLSAPVLTIALGLCLYYVLRNSLPKFTATITGGR